MICVSVFYPNTPGKKFDGVYYAETHLPMVKNLLKSFGMSHYEFDKGLGGGDPGTPAPFRAIGRLYLDDLGQFQEGMAKHGDQIRGDVPNYTDIVPQIQISQMA